MEGAGGGGCLIFRTPNTRYEAAGDGVLRSSGVQQREEWGGGGGRVNQRTLVTWARRCRSEASTVWANQWCQLSSVAAAVTASWIGRVGRVGQWKLVLSYDPPLFLRGSAPIRSVNAPLFLLYVYTDSTVQQHYEEHGQAEASRAEQRNAGIRKSNTLSLSTWALAASPAPRLAPRAQLC